MKRKEQIENGFAEAYPITTQLSNIERGAFIDGAEWADSTREDFLSERETIIHEKLEQAQASLADAVRLLNEVREKSRAMGKDGGNFLIYTTLGDKIDKLLDAEGKKGGKG